MTGPEAHAVARHGIKEFVGKITTVRVGIIGVVGNRRGEGGESLALEGGGGNQRFVDLIGEGSKEVGAALPNPSEHIKGQLPAPLI